MKKHYFGLIALTVLLALTACSQKDTAKPAGTPAWVANLQKPGKLVIGTSPDYPPYEAYDAAGKLVGFEIDALTEIAAILSQEQAVTIEWVPMGFDTIISAVQAGQVDIGVSCFTYNPDREGQVLFTKYYLKSSQVAVVTDKSPLKTIADLAGKKIGAGNGTTGEAAAKEIKDTKVSEMGDYVQMFEVLKNGGLDAVVCDEAVGVNYAKQKGYKLLEGKLVDEEVMIITNNKNKDLVQALNQAIDKFVATEKYKTLKTAWKLN